MLTTRFSKIQESISENSSKGPTQGYLKGIGEQKSMDSFPWFALSQEFIFIGNRGVMQLLGHLLSSDEPHVDASLNEATEMRRIFIACHFAKRWNT